jgi:hypothetical protein
MWYRGTDWGVPSEADARMISASLRILNKLGSVSGTLFRNGEHVNRVGVQIQYRGPRANPLDVGRT